MRLRCSHRFSASNALSPASTMTIDVPGRRSDTFHASSAAEMPPPMMQTSDS